jgi:YesN/AraC family two-component response regulator
MAEDTLVSLLIVEDEQDALDALASIMGMIYPDITIHTAVDGKTGLALFKVHRPHIVITDINLPELNGLQMAQQIRLIQPDTRIIVLTADTGKSTLEKAAGMGFKIDHYLTKPLVFSLMFEAVGQCLEAISQG